MAAAALAFKPEPEPHTLKLLLRLQSVPARQALSSRHYESLFQNMGSTQHSQQMERFFPIDFWEHIGNMLAVAVVSLALNHLLVQTLNLLNPTPKL